ncbi:hypothetical protein HOF56_04220 [Candidatus Peribacteria bacterium]|jgi:hypothetical protein|nr:hypothetical protein [Candidatus Peribacteria bacterium]MBT4021694.1 hypothetical protein [Candidatus Peribacteria bacterium]MBT4240278.1 hypothetical protein [Candidatus Peribacteria bacterium]MBT4473893.1 hypothetical protein [Candidatus Peribacteria bacterium]
MNTAERLKAISVIETEPDEDTENVGDVNTGLITELTVCAIGQLNDDEVELL